MQLGNGQSKHHIVASQDHSSPSHAQSTRVCAHQAVSTIALTSLMCTKLSSQTMSENVSLAETAGDGRRSALQEHPIGKVLDLSIQLTQQPLDTGDNRTLQVPGADPRLWKRTDVKNWLLWAVKFYQVDDVDTTKFTMNGRGLCLLTRSGFMNRAPSCGDILHSDFQRRYAVAVVRTEKERRNNRRRLHVMFDSESTTEAKKSKEEAEKQ